MHGCIDSPLLDSLGFMVECPCCEQVANTSAMHNVPVCACRNAFAAHYTGGGLQNPHEFARADLARFRAETHQGPAWQPWSGYYVLDQLAIGGGHAMNNYSSIWNSLEGTFGQRPSMFRSGFLPERLLGTALREEAAQGRVTVRVIDWLQWGVRREAAAPEWRSQAWLFGKS